MTELDALIQGESVTGLKQFVARLRQIEEIEKLCSVSTANVSEPPTSGELDAIFGTEATLPEGICGIVDDNGAGTAVWLNYVVNSVWRSIRFGLTGASEKTWAFDSPPGATGTFYYGGYYFFGATDNDFNPAITHGAANASYAAHFFLVQAVGAGGGDTTVQISGTSITDQGVRTAADTEDLVVDDAGAAGTFYETGKKWIGQVTITKTAGPDLLCNYGFCKYWDNNNNDFNVAGVEATWLGGANDTTPNISLLHHRPTGWTYNPGAPPTRPSSIADMNTDHVTEIQVRNGENGAWKRDNLSTFVNGDSSEGTIIEVLTSSNRAFEFANVIMRITPA